MSTVEHELLDLERQYWQAIKDRNVDAALRLTDDSCIVAGPSGVSRLDKPQLARMIREAPYELEEFVVEDNAQVRMLDDNTAVLAYTVHEKLNVEGKSVILDAADASTWVRRDGQWVCALHSEALAGDPFGRDK
jgi:hypothetical protein